jgi:hypothetical protein
LRRSLRTLIPAIGRASASAFQTIGSFEVGAEVELGLDGAAAVSAGRGQSPDSIHRVDRGLDRLGDLAFDDIGRGAPVRGGDRNVRRVEGRKLPHTEK